MEPSRPLRGPHRVSTASAVAALVVLGVLLAPGLPTVAHVQTQSSGSPTIALLTTPMAYASQLIPSRGFIPTQSIPLGSPPVAVTYDSANGHVYVASSNVTVISTVSNSVLGQVPLPPALESYYYWPTAETYDGWDGFVYVAGYSFELCTGCGGPWTVAINGSTDVIAATNTSLGGIDVPDYFDCLGFNPANGVVYACDTSPGKMVLMKGSTDDIVGTIPVGALPSSVAMDAGNGDVYVANWGSDDVTVIRGATNAVVGSIPVGSQPDGLAFDGGNGYLYVANNASDNVTVIDGGSNTVVRSIPVGCNPDAVAYDSADGNVYVANSCSTNLTVISGATDTVIGSVPVGSDPVGIAYDRANARLYVANLLSDNLTVIQAGSPPPPTNYTVTFSESRLPSGQTWSVTFDSVTKSLTTDGGTDTLTFAAEPNGTYSYSIADNPGYHQSTIPYTGTETVSGAPLSVSVSYTPVTFGVTFSESGLPAGSSFEVMLNGSAKTSTTPLVRFAEPNGSYLYTVFPEGRFAAYQSEGTAGVKGSNSTIPVQFGFTANLEFVLNGYPNGESWVLNVTNATIGFYVHEVGNRTVITNLAFANVTYAYSITFPLGNAGWNRSGNVTVGIDGATVTISAGTGSSGTTLPSWVWPLLVVVILALVVGTVFAVRSRGPKTPQSPTEFQPPAGQQPPPPPPSG